MSKFLKFFCKACKSPFYTAYKATRCINCGSEKIIPQGRETDKEEWDRETKQIDKNLNDIDRILDELEDMDEEDGF